MIYGFDENRQKHEVVGANLPHIIETYDDGAGSGYRLYSDGWCEQWGRVTATGTVTVTFHIPFTTTDYLFITYLISTSTSGRTYATFGQNATLTTCQYNTAGITPTRWSASGYVNLQGV